MPLAAVLGLKEQIKPTNCEIVVCDGNSKLNFPPSPVAPRMASTKILDALNAFVTFSVVLVSPWGSVWILGWGVVAEGFDAVGDFFWVLAFVDFFLEALHAFLCTFPVVGCVLLGEIWKS